MSCPITNGFLGLGCLEQSGAKKFYIANWDASTDFTADANLEITGVTSGNSYYTFEQELETIDLQEGGEVAGGAYKYSHTLVVKFQKLTSEVKNLVKLLTITPVTIIVEGTDGVKYLMGGGNVTRATSIAGTYGVGFLDEKGYTMTFGTTSANPSPIIQDTATGLTIVAN